MGNNIVVAVGFLPERDAGIIGSDSDCFYRQHVVFLHISNGLCRVKVRHNHNVMISFFDEGCKRFRQLCICPVNRRFEMAVTDKHSQFINETEKPRQMLYNPNIKSADKA